MNEGLSTPKIILKFFKKYEKVSKYGKSIDIHRRAWKHEVQKVLKKYEKVRNLIDLI